jgi:nitrilase
LTFSPKGEMIGKHRKLMPTASERLVWGFGDGSTMQAVDTDLGKHRHGDLLGELHAHAAHAYVRSGRAALLRAHCGLPRHLEAHHADHSPGGALLCAHRRQYLTRGDCPEEYAALFEPFGGDTPETVLMRGGAHIVDPLGEVLVEPDFSGPGRLHGRSGSGSDIRGKYDMDVAGHYARPDVFQLVVDTKEKKPVISK